MTIDATPISLTDYQAELFNAFGHPARLAILEFLRQGEACVCHIQAGLNFRQAYLSQHLNILRQSGLVHRRKAGQYWYYKLADPVIAAIMDQSAALIHNLRGQLAIIDKPVFTDGLPQGSACRCPECCTKTNLLLEK